MPLLGKEEFTLQPLPPNLDPNTEVFYCSSTGEAFLSYDEYFERNMLCSSLFWTCSVTGKGGLTYADALKSERESQNLLSSVPRVLQKVLLHLMKYMNNFSTNVVLSILLEYTNLRYFIGENVQILSNKSKRINGFIRDVIPPENSVSSTSIAYGIDPLSYQYAVEINGNKAYSKDGERNFEIVSSSRISRPKCLITREKLRLFLKQHLSPKSGRYDTLSIKDESVHKFGLDHLKWEDIFKGPTPNFNDDTTILKAFNKRLSDVAEPAHNTNHNNHTPDKNNDETSMQVVKKKSNILSAQKLKLIKREEKKEKTVTQEIVSKKKDKKQKLKEKLKGSKSKKGKKKEKSKKDQISEEQSSANSKQDKIDEKKKSKEFRRKFEEDTRSWNEKRDDLLCDDLKPLPKSTIIDCDIDLNLFGDSLVIIEFINAFKDYFRHFHNVFPSGISVSLFAQILKDVDVYGPYGDLLQILLDTILFNNADTVQEGDLKIKTNDEFDVYNNDDENSANFCNNNFSNHWVSTYFGTHEQLAQLKLDSFTLTEILRIYILKARNNDMKRSRCDDDEDVSLAIRLTTYSVFELNQVERITLLNLLLNDLVKVPSIRLKIEDSMEEIFRHKSQIRHLNASFTKWLRDNPIRQRIRKKKSDSSDNKETEQPESEASLAEKEQYKRDKNQREQQMKKNISELKAKIRKLSSFCRPRPLGLDRSFRRYWVLQSISGLLVEHPVEETQPCLEAPIPMPKPQLTDYLPNAKRRKRKNSNKKDDNSNQENGFIVAPLDPSNMHIFERCSGNYSTCSVHGKVNSDKRTRWSFYTKEQLDDFIEALNARGYRENELKNSLNIEKNSILKYHLEKFVPTDLNPNYLPPLDEPSEEPSEEELMENNLLRKSERIQNQVQEKVVPLPKPVEPVAKHVKSQNQYSHLDPLQAHEAAFRDELLNLEDNIFNSCLNSFKLDDRDDWYKNAPNDPNGTGDRIKSIENLSNLLKSLAQSLRPFCLLSPLSVPQSSASSPSDKENIEHVQPKVPVLSNKWAEVLKAADGLVTGQLDDFESSYGISNLSQLFVNLFILDKSINWELSAMKTATKCRICRRKANDEMILCDKCNRGYHIYCLKPPISSIDEIEGDWFCYTCDPTPKTSLRKNISSKLVEVKEVEFQDEEEEEEQSYDEVADEEYASEESFEDDNGTICRVCKHRLYDEYSEVLCKSCSKGYHLKCVNLVRVPRSWNCLSCESQERYNSTHSDESSDLRRSNRKRKPNHYYDDPNSLDDQLYSDNTRPKRYLSSEDNVNRRTQRVV